VLKATYCVFSITRCSCYNIPKFQVRCSLNRHEGVASFLAKNSRCFLIVVQSREAICRGSNYFRSDYSCITLSMWYTLRGKDFNGGCSKRRKHNTLGRLWLVVEPRGVGCFSTYSQDQFFKSSIFDEKMIGLGWETVRKLLKWLWQPNRVVILGSEPQDHP